MHIKTVHTDKSPFKCDSCNKSFTSVSQLNGHIKTVRRRDFNCGSCDKSFKTSSHLNTHTKTVHEGKRDNICQTCGK